MKLLFFYMVGADYGYGHRYRTRSCMLAAANVGWQVYSVSNDWEYDARLPQLGVIFPSHSPHKAIASALADSISAYEPDWIVIDLPSLPDYLYPVLLDAKTKVASLNGVGHFTHDDFAYDLVWEQSLPEFAILREDVLKHRQRIDYEPRPNGAWLVFGGAADVLSLQPAFSAALPDQPARIIKTQLTKESIYDYPEQHSLVETDRNSYINLLSECDRMCFHLGMSVWEASYFRKPIYIFSSSENHLHDALHFEELGLAKAYPQAGLPDKDSMREFLLTEFYPTGKAPDGLGAYRFLDMLALDTV